MWSGTITRFVALAMLICCSTAGRAEVWVQMAGNVVDFTEDATASGTSRSLASATAGYLFAQGFQIGVQGLRSEDEGVSTWAVGPKGGFFYKGLELTAAYLPFAGDSLNREGGGIAFNFGYNVAISRLLHFGIYGTYWSTTFATQNATDLSPRPVVRVLSPELALGFQF